MSDEFDLDTHCVVCREPRGSHPTESNNPRPLFDEGRACRDCDSYIIASRMMLAGLNEELRDNCLFILRQFLNGAASIKEAKRIADEMMQTEMTRLEAEETARNEAGCPDCGYIEDDVATHYENCVHFDTDLIADDDTEEDWE
jgi:hypothetical protein